MVTILDKDNKKAEKMSDVDAVILENEKSKVFVSPNYKYEFNKINGNFKRWGKTKEDDPEYSPWGPELLDIEISTICHGLPNSKGILTPCPHCYKSNTKKGTNMSFETYKQLFSKFPKGPLTQIAFGIGSLTNPDGTLTNPDLFKILQFTRDNKVVPNITLSGVGLTNDLANQLSKVLGACAISLYEDKNICYNAVELLSSYIGKPNTSLMQCNIHSLLSKETVNRCQQVLTDYTEDKRLKNLNAVVFLQLKQKNRGQSYHQVSLKQYRELIDFAFSNNIPFGMDSCSAGNFIREAKIYLQEEQFKKIEQSVESCESFGCFSGYVNCQGIYYPCSFAEGIGDWKEGIDVLHCTDFLNDAWYSKKVCKYRKLSIESKDEHGCRHCLLFDLNLK